MLLIIEHVTVNTEDQRYLLDSGGHCIVGGGGYPDGYLELGTYPIQQCTYHDDNDFKHIGYVQCSYRTLKSSLSHSLRKTCKFHCNL